MSTSTGSDTPALPAAVDVFDTTLRDGAQFEGISLTVEDKLRVAEHFVGLGEGWLDCPSHAADETVEV